MAALAKRMRGRLADEVCRQLADEIVLGRFVPGARLDEAMLASRFGVSRTPVRETLRQLAVTGLVVYRPNRGSVVASLDPEQLDCMFSAGAAAPSRRPRQAGALSCRP